MARVLLTGATGFIGRELLCRLAAAEHEVTALTRRPDAAARLAVAGARPVVGDLREPGAWGARAREADLVVHLAQPLAFGRSLEGGGRRVTRARAEAYRRDRLLMDANLLDAARGATRIVYVAGTSYYGDTGPARVSEDATPRPRGWGPYIAPAVEEATRRAERGSPIVMAFPGHVYGDGSWFRDYVLRPLRSGAPLFAIAGLDPVASPVHVRDAARALVHLATHGEAGARYFVVDDEPLPWRAFYGRAADAVGVPLRVRALPPALLRALVGPVVTESLTCRAALSNDRLRRLGFELELPTTAKGIPDVVDHARPTSPVPSLLRLLLAEAKRAMA